MCRIVVTLDVSKLSGWLNAFAFCRVEGRACDMREEVRAGRREGVGWRRRMRRARVGPDSRLGGQGTRRAGMRRRATAVHAACTQGRARLQIGGRAWEERTVNIQPMFVTLEVSKLSGWLNACASCRGLQGGHSHGAGRAASREAGEAAGPGERSTSRGRQGARLRMGGGGAR